MSTKQIISHRRARTQLKEGLDQLARVVGLTLGPRGRSVLLEQSWGAPLVTKDGITVAKAIELQDPASNLGVQLGREVAALTGTLVGDGTTTSTILAQAIYSEGLKLVSAGIDPVELKRGIDRAVAVVVAELKAHSQPISSDAELAQVAPLSANGDEVLGKLVAEAMARVGRDGIVTVEDSPSTETSLEVTTGLQFPRGYLSRYFMTDHARQEVALDDCLVLLVATKLSDPHELIPLLEQVKASDRPLLVIATELEPQVLTTLVVNKLQANLQVCAVKAPGFGERGRARLEDLAVLCGTRVVSAELGQNLSTWGIEELGHVKRVLVARETTTLVDAHGDKQALQGRIAQLRLELEATDSEFERTQLGERVAQLAGGVAIIRVGATTEAELKEKKSRLDDALHATRAAVKEGIVAGGGVALLRTQPALQDLKLPGEQRYGVQIVERAIEQPLRQIAANAGIDAAVAVACVSLKTGAFGYNAATGRYEDMILAKVIDPTMVVRVALENAASIAGLMLATEVTISSRKAP